VLVTTMVVVDELPCNTERLVGFAVSEKSAGPLLKVPDCTVSESVVPKWSATKTQVSLLVLEGEQLGSEGYAMLVVPEPAIL